MGIDARLQATALVAAVCRQEIDPYAHLFTSNLDAAQRALAASGRDEVVTRTRLIDQLLLAALQRRPDCTIVNLGAGLCTRPYRLDLSSCPEVIELDAAPVLDLKTETLHGYQPSCPVRRIPGDVRDLPALPTPAIVITEGLLVYLPEPRLRDLATALARLPTPATWLADIMSADSAAAMTVIAGQSGTALALSGLTTLAPFEQAGWHVSDYHPLLVNRPPHRFAPRPPTTPASRTVVDGVIELIRN